MKFRGGRIPYGFLVQNGVLAFDSEGSGPDLVKLMKFHQLGYSYRSIADALVSQGWKGPAGGEWNYGSVARVVARGKELSHLIPIEYVI